MPDIVTGALEFTKTDSIADIDGGKVWDRSAAGSDVRNRPSISVQFFRPVIPAAGPF